MEKRKFWPLDFDPEGEIYENVAWDLPGYDRPRKRDLPRANVRLKTLADCSRKHTTL